MTHRYLDTGLKLIILVALAIAAMLRPASGQQAIDARTPGESPTVDERGVTMQSTDSLQRLLAFRPDYVDDPVRLMIVGSFHFANPGQDMVNPDAGDVLSPRRQAEIARLLDDLAAFRPNKIALEIRTDRDSAVQARYGAIVAGRAEPGRSEREQLGMRLAARLGHERVYPVDHRQGLAMGEVLGWAAEHEPRTAARAGEVFQNVGPVLQRLIDGHTIPEIILAMNAEMSDISHGIYLDMALIGAGDDRGWIGSEVAIDWYERNLKIFGNIARIAEPGDRILVVYGAGHEYLLRHFGEMTPGFEVVQVREYVNS